MKQFISILLIVVLMFSLASVVFAETALSPEKQNTKVTPQKTGKASPQTGETNAIFWVIAALVLSIGVVLFCGKKLVLEK